VAEVQALLDGPAFVKTVRTRRKAIPGARALMIFGAFFDGIQSSPSAEPRRLFGL